MRSKRARSPGLLLLFAGALALGLASGAQAARRRPAPSPQLVVSGPAHGTFTQAATIDLTGQVLHYGNEPTALLVNGVAVAVAPDGTFAHPVALDAAAVVNKISTRLVRTDLPPNVFPQVDRRVVFAGDSVADGDFSLEGIALRLNDSGLDALEPFIAGLVSLDPATLVPPGTEVISNFCYASLFGLCIGSVDVFIDGNPPPSISGFSIDVDSQTDVAFGDITLNDLFVRARVEDDIGVPLTCFINTNSVTTAILGDYALAPGAPDPTLVDVAQVGGVSVVFGGFSDSTDCSGLLGGLVELLIGLFIGDVQTLFDDAFTDFLNQPDAAGNTPVAGAIEAALAGIQIAGPIGESLGVSLDAPLFDVAEDVDGITLGSDAAITADFGTGPGQCEPPGGAPDLLASLHVDEAFPVFGATTPGGLPYGLGICVSTSAFNQLLKAEVECGLLQGTLTELEILGFLFPIDAGLLSVFIPQFGLMDPATPLEIRLRPTSAPFLTGNAGPNGELGEMRLAQLEADLVTPADGRIWMSFAADVRLGLEFSFDGATSSLIPQIGDVAPADVDAEILSNEIGADVASVTDLLPTVLAPALPSLSDSLGSFPFPTFLGLQLQAVEIAREGAFLSIYADLVPPAP